MKHCELCLAYTNAIETYRSRDGDIHDICDDCVDMIRYGEPIDDKTENDETDKYGHSNVSVSGLGSGHYNPPD